MDGRQSDGRDLCLGLLPQLPTAYFHPSLLVPVKINMCLSFVTDFGIVCLDRLPFYRNDVTRSARAHEYQNRSNEPATKSTEPATTLPVRSTLSPVRSTLTKVLIFVESRFDIRLCRQCVPGLTLLANKKETRALENNTSRPFQQGGAACWAITISSFVWFSWITHS